jgi:hypothetical protein
VIRTRDVTFDEGKFYSPNKPDLAQLSDEPTVMTLSLPPLLTGSSVREDEDIYSQENLTGSLLELTKNLTENLTGSSLEFTDSLELNPINAPATTAATMDAPELHADKSNTQLPTPPHSERAVSSTVDERVGGHTEREEHTRRRAGNNTATRRGEISAELDVINVLPEGSKRTRKPRKDAYSTAL